jgi:hypothetical protein
VFPVKVAGGVEDGIDVAPNLDGHKNTQGLVTKRAERHFMAQARWLLEA